ncbi:hypothetical protein GQ457_02G027620 [Hibiscus cannabinus]
MMRNENEVIFPSNYYSPPLDVLVVFLQATLASTFPFSVSNYYQFSDVLRPEDQALHKKVRECMEKEASLIMVDYWEKANFPFKIIPKFGVICVAGHINQGIFRIQCQVGTMFKQVVLSEGFIEIHTPKLITSSSEGIGVEMDIKNHYFEMKNIMDNLIVIMLDVLNEMCTKAL